MIGIHHDIPATHYHADDFGPIPTLSSSIARALLDEAPVKAWMAHPRLGGPREETEPTRAKEIGTAAHKLILGRGGDVVEVDADDYKKTGAKDARAAAYDAGQCPILAADLVLAEAMANVVHRDIGDIPDCDGFMGAPAEVVVIARDASGAMLRIMVDKLEIRRDRAIIWDVKTGASSAAPHELGRRIETMGMDLQAMFYTRVLTLALPHLAGRIEHRHLFIENEAPHLHVVSELDGTGREMGRRKTAYAIALWNQCLASGEWPGYPRRIVQAEYPTWAETRWMEREIAYAAVGVDAVATTMPEPRIFLGAK